MTFSVITFPYHCDGWDAGTDKGPEALLGAGLIERLQEHGHEINGPRPVRLTSDEERQYGAWNRIGLANAHLARLVAEARGACSFPLILESNCYATLGVLAGLQRRADSFPARVGLVWVDAHADFNTPETTPSGMLSGMPVAIATGLCLHRLRRTADLKSPIFLSDVVMVTVRATDALEQEAIERYRIEVIQTVDLRSGCERLRRAMWRLSKTVDLIYLHFDIDALDSAEVLSTWISAPKGPSTSELGNALKIAGSYPKVAAFGLSDVNPAKDVEGQMLEKALTLTLEAISGIAQREIR